MISQGAALAILLIVPLFAKTAHLAVATLVPVPPYHRPAAARPVTPVAAEAPRPRGTDFDAYSAPTQIPPGIAVTDHAATGAPADGLDSLETQGAPPCAMASGCIPLDRSSAAPPPPPPVRNAVQTIRRASLSPAMLIHKVEPIYPAPARQLRISGSVVLHALIATDGSVQSLEVVSGHPLLIPSALDAVRQWRYRPTLLNGQPVQVDTFVTVIYRFEY